MNLASLDLNLLVALDGLISEVHVGQAARKIGRIAGVFGRNLAASSESPRCRLFDPGTSSRHFSVMTPDHVAHLVVDAWP